MIEDLEFVTTDVPVLRLSCTQGGSDRSRTQDIRPCMDNSRRMAGLAVSIRKQNKNRIRVTSGVENRIVVLSV